MRILVLQTTRMGNVLQTSPLITGIRERYPDAHIAVMVRRMGKAVADRHPDIDEVLVYEEDELYLDMKANDSDRLLHAYETAAQRLRELRDAHFALAYNLTHSIASAMLLKLAGIPKVIGAHLTDEGQYVLRGAWTTYFFTSVFNREYNDLNLCDIARHFEPGKLPHTWYSRFALPTAPPSKNYWRVTVCGRTNPSSACNWARVKKTSVGTRRISHGSRKCSRRSTAHASCSWA